MANETYNILQGIFNGQTPIQRSEPMSGQSEYYYMKPNQNSYTPLSQMQKIDVPTKDTPNPYLIEENNTQYFSKTFGDYFAENILDVSYGVNRAVNGLTFGELDKLGKRYGFDSSMSDYANLRGGNIRQLGEYAQVGGNMLPTFLLGGTVGNAIRPYYNAWQIGRGYDRLKTNPYQGKGTDVITRMKNHNGETVMLQRGEAIPGENGRVITSGGKSFKKATGTERNYGLNKAIYKHDLDKSQVTKMPKMLRENPVQSNEYGQYVYENTTPKGKLRLVTSKINDGKNVSSMYIVDR